MDMTKINTGIGLFMIFIYSRLRQALRCIADGGLASGPECVLGSRDVNKNGIRSNVVRRGSISSSINK